MPMSRTPSTSSRSRATANTSPSKGSCASIAAVLGETTGSHSPMACRSVIATSTCSATPCASIRSTPAASISEPPAARYTPPPTRETRGRRSCAIFRPSCRSRSRRCHDPGDPPDALANAGAHGPRVAARGPGSGNAAIRPRRARSLLSHAARDHPRPRHQRAPAFLAFLRLRGGRLPSATRCPFAGGGRLGQRTLLDHRRHRRRLAPPCLSSLFDDPVVDVGGAVEERDALCFTGAQEANHLHIDQAHFVHIQSDLRSALLDLLCQFLQVFRLHPPDQSNRRAVAIRITFDLQGHELSKSARLCARNVLHRDHPRCPPLS